MQLAKKNVRHFNTLNHEGKLLIVTTIVEQGVAKLFYTIKQDGFEDSALNQSQNTGWEDFKEVVFPNEVGGDTSVAAYEQEQMTDATGKYLLRSLYQSAAMTADAPVQLVSHEGHVYLFRQSLTGTLLVDRFVLDGITNSLVPKYEVRFRRSRQRYKPLKEGKLNAGGRMESVDSLGFRDMRDQFFFEPTTEVCPGILNQLTNGWFAVVATPTNEPDQYRWHIFAYNGATKKVDLVTLRANSERLFEVRDYGFRTVDETEDVNYAAVPGIIYRTLAFENEGDPLTITNGLAATRYDIQRTQEVEDGDTQLMRDDTKLLLAVPTDQGIATVSFGIAADGTLAQFGEAGQQTLRSQDREVFLPHSTLDNIRALAAKASATEGAIAGLSLATGDENVTNRVHVTTGSADGAKSLSYGDLVELTESTSLDGLYQVESPTPEGFKITPTSKSLGSWTKVETEEPELIFDGLITGYELKDGKLQVNAVNHGLTEKDLVQLVGTRDYNGQYPVLKADQNSFTIERLWVNGEVLNVKINSAKRRGLVFDGKDDYIEIPLNDGLKAHKRFTLEAWVKVPSGERQILFDTGQAALEVSRGKFAVRLRQTSGDSIPLSADNKVVTDQWVHIAGVFDGAELTLYENGELQGSAKKVSGSPRFSYAPAFMLGRHHEKTANFLDGELAEVRLWNTARSPKQIKDSMNLNLTGRETGLVGYWRLGGLAIEDDGSQRVFDFSVNANHGLAHGAPYASGVTLKRKLKDGTTDASKFSNSDLVAVVEGETYEESFEFQVDSDAISFKPSYWGRVGEAAEGKIKITPLENYQDFKLEKLNGNWQRATCRFVVPPGVRVVRCFELDQVTGKWANLSLRRHRLHLISDRVTLATASDTVRLNNSLPERLWQVRRKLSDQIGGHQASTPFTAAYSPKGDHIVTALGATLACVWDVAKGAVALTLKGHTDFISSVAYSPDGKHLVTASWDCSAKIWDATTGSLEATLGGKSKNKLAKGAASYLYSAAYSPDGYHIVTADLSGVATIWDVKTKARVQALNGHTKFVTSAVYSPDGNHILTASGDGTACIWDALTGKPLIWFKGHKDVVHSARYSPDGKLIVTASGDKTAIIWDVATGNAVRTLSGHKGYVRTAVFSPDGKRVVTASGDNAATIWDAATGAVAYTLSGKVTDVITSATYSPDGQYIVTASTDGSALIWRPAYFFDVKEMAGEQTTYYNLITPDGHVLEIYENNVGTGDHWFDTNTHSFHQDWEITSVAPESDYYTIKNRKTHAKLGGSLGKSPALAQGDGLQDYEWKFEKSANGYYKIQSKTGMVLAVGGDNYWRLEPVLLSHDLAEILNTLTMGTLTEIERAQETNRFMLGLQEGGARPQWMDELPEQTDPRDLIVKGALLDFAQSASRIQALESSEGSVILSYQDQDGNLRQTRCNTTDADGSQPETWCNDKYRACLAFDGKADKLQLPAALCKELGGQWTIEFWAKSGAALPKGAVFLEASDDKGALIARISLPGTDNQVVWEIGTTSERVTADATGYRDRWAHWAFVLDGDNKVAPKIYFNGQPLTTSKSAAPKTTAKNVPALWQGQLAELRIWNEALSASELETNSKVLLSGNEPGLLAYYPLTDYVLIDTTGTTARNLAAPALPLTVNNTQWSPFTGSLNRIATPILSFEGRSFVQLPVLTAAFDPGFTLEARVRFDSLKEWMTVIDLGEPDGHGNIRLTTTDKSNQLCVETFPGIGLRVDNVVKPGEWLHVVATVGGNEGRLYINGVKKVTAKNFSPPPGGRRSSNYIGKSNSTVYKNLFAGDVTEVRLWNCARTEEQIKANMNGPLATREPHLLAYWPLDNVAPDNNSSNVAIVEYSRVEVDDQQKRSVMLKRCAVLPGEDSIHLLDEKRIEELDLKWVGNAQIKPTLVGYIEGPPPVPSENLTEEDDYNGAAAVELIQASDVEYSWTREQDVSTGAEIELFLGIRSSTSAGVGVQTSIEEVDSGMKSAADFAYHWQNASTVAASHSLMTSEKLELRGSREVTPKFAHLGQRFVPKNVGYALVTSGLADVFVSRLKRSGRMLGYQVLPVEGVPLDVNTITFMINPTYTMSGCLDGMTGSSATSNRFHSHVPEMRAQYGSLYPASYFRLKEAYALKQEIEQRDQEHAAYFHQFNARLVDETSLGRQIEDEDDALLKEIDRKILDNETELDRLKRIEAKTGKTLDTADQAQRKKCEDELILLEAERKKRQEVLQRERQRTGESRQLEIAQAFDDQSKRAHASESFQSWQRKMEALQLRAGKRNIVNTYVWDGDGGFHAEEQQFASTIEHSVGGSFELNLMVGFSGQHAFSKVATDLTALAKVGLTQTMTKTESSSKGLELHVDLSGMESRGITDHRDFPLMPGEKVDRYRFMSFFLEPHSTHFHDFFNTVVDPEWLMSNDEEARALRQTMFAQPNKVWRVLHRVTYVERPALIGYGASLTPPPAEDEFGELRQQLEALNQKIEELKTAVAKLKK